MKAAVALVVAVALALCAAAPATATPEIDVTCNGTECLNGWYRTIVYVDWTWAGGSPVDGCFDLQLTADTIRTEQACIVRDSGGVTASLTVPLRIDKTPPVVLGAAAARPPDHAGWYTAPVAVTFSGSDATSGLAACSTTTYAAGDSGNAKVTGSCTDVAGNVSPPFGFPLRYDATPPTITGLVPARPPDRDGWYRAPVTVTARATDAASGVAGCEPVAFRGPDSATATVTAGCRDRAGNLATGTLPLRYDATAPDTSGIRAEPADRVVRLELPAGATATIVRSPGVGGAAQTRLAGAATGAFADRAVRNGRTYRYEVTLTDQAGNAASRTVRAVPGPRLRAPAARALVTAPPLLSWTPVRGARYYNVQLERDGKKILSRWPSRARLQLPATWRFKGRRHTLRPGRYRWLVWPGEGPRAAGRYGRRIGARSFEVVVPPQ